MSGTWARELGDAGLSRMHGLTGRDAGGYRFDGFLVNPRWSFLDFLVNTEG